MSGWSEAACAQDLAKTIAMMSKRPSGSVGREELVQRCIEALPTIRAESAADALALLVVARQMITLSAASLAEGAETLTMDEGMAAFAWSTSLMDRVIAMLEASSGVAAETFAAKPLR